MKLLKSEKFTLPQVFFITDKKEIKDLPKGVPFIFGDPIIEKYLIRILEYEVLFQAALKSGYPFNFRKILLENGYDDVKKFPYQITSYMEFDTDHIPDKFEGTDEIKLTELGPNANRLRDYIKDSAAFVDVNKLKELNVFPVWMNKIEDAINTNLHNFAAFNPNMYNKKLDGMYGGIELTSPDKNLIIIDISASIPKAVGSTCLTMSKNLAEAFYADVLLTGAQSVLFPYENLHELDVETAYDMYGNNNECKMFRQLVTENPKKYKTAVVFGDNHSPCGSWGGSPRISREDAQKLCKWEVEKVISFHTTSNRELAGYADWFSPNEVEYISDWVRYVR